MQGIQGIESVQGIQGYQGIQGEYGVQGVQGIQGYEGIPGIIYYYYFKMNNNTPLKIVRTEFVVNTDIMYMYQSFTQEQYEFYMLHPTASVYEVYNCELNPTPSSIEPTIEQLRQNAKSELDFLSRKALGTKVDTLSFCNAIASDVFSQQRNREAIYSNDEILKTADDFLTISNACHTRYLQDAELIEEAMAQAELDVILENARTYFENLVTDQDNIERHRQDKLREIDVYDTSEMVNGFFLNDTLLWLNKETRTGLVNTLNSAVFVGRSQINIWFSGLYITLDVEQARQMLAALEIYATDCYNVTAMHKVQVNELETIEDINDFDVSAGYPNRLEFHTT